MTEMVLEKTTDRGGGSCGARPLIQSHLGRIYPFQLGSSSYGMPGALARSNQDRSKLIRRSARIGVSSRVTIDKSRAWVLIAPGSIIGTPRALLNTRALMRR